MAVLLIEHDADVNEGDSLGQTPLYATAEVCIAQHQFFILDCFTDTKIALKILCIMMHR